MEVLKSGIGVTVGDGNIPFGGVCNFLMLRVASGSTTIVRLDDRADRRIRVGTTDHYDAVPISCSSITVESGTLDYVALSGDE